MHTAAHISAIMQTISGSRRRADCPRCD